jgi:hypothetical protein
MLNILKQLEAFRLALLNTSRIFQRCIRNFIVMEVTYVYRDYQSNQAFLFKGILVKNNIT